MAQRGIHVIILLALGAAALSGCTESEKQSHAPVSEAALPDWAVIEETAPARGSFETTSAAGGQVTIAATFWGLGEGRAEAVLLVHGAYGNSLGVWGPASVPGYSMVHRLLEAGYAVVVIDRPGYGNSSAPSEIQAHEAQAYAISQVAQRLHAGEYDVVSGSSEPFAWLAGVGHSFGGRTVMMAQGVYGGFDAIVSIGWSHAPHPAEFRACLNGSGPCPPTLIDRFIVREAMEPAVVSYFENLTLEALPVTEWSGSWLGMGCYACVRDELELVPKKPSLEDAYARTIDIPTLMVLGLEDYVIEPTSLQDEQQVFASADDLEVVHIPETGHMIWHHESKVLVFNSVVGWIDHRARGPDEG